MNKHTSGGPTPCKRRGRRHLTWRGFSTSTDVTMRECFLPNVLLLLPPPPNILGNRRCSAPLSQLLFPSPIRFSSTFISKIYSSKTVLHGAKHDQKRDGTEPRCATRPLDRSMFWERHESDESTNITLLTFVTKLQLTDLHYTQQARSIPPSTSERTKWTCALAFNIRCRSTLF